MPDTCHCGGSFNGSDHCPCCGCEEHEATCDHKCLFPFANDCVLTHEDYDFDE